MNFYSFTRAACAALGLSALTACGSSEDDSGSGPLLQTPNSALFVSSGPNLSLSVLGIDRTTDLSFSETTTLNRPNTLSGGRLNGTASYQTTFGAQNSIALTSGGSAAIEDVGNAYVFRFGDAGMFGVAGLEATNIPGSGLATYSGKADALVNDGSGPPIALTDVVATANFGTGRVDTRLTNSQSYWVAINNAVISGSRYSGGELSASTRFATQPGTSGSLVHEGAFFEQNAGEIGGVFLLDRTSAGETFKAQGAYTGAD